MTRRHPPCPVPRRWLLTDPRIAVADCLAAARRLPKGSGVLVRHGEWDRADRLILARRLGRIARQRGLLLGYAGDDAEARHAGAAWMHARHGARGPLPRSAPAHDLAEVRAAERAGAALLFVSPVHPTRSHPGAQTLRTAGFMRLARAARVPVVALGGMTCAKAALLDRRVVHGWAAIDGLSRRQARQIARP